MSEPTRIERIVETRYGLDLRALDQHDLEEVIALYETRRQMLKDLHGMEVYEHEDYRKAFYVVEAARTILREIMPRGRRKKKTAK